MGGIAEPLFAYLSWAISYSSGNAWISDCLITAFWGITPLKKTPQIEEEKERIKR
jgi:hypothetical protein